MKYQHYFFDKTIGPTLDLLHTSPFNKQSFLFHKLQENSFFFLFCFVKTCSNVSFNKGTTDSRRFLFLFYFFFFGFVFLLGKHRKYIYHPANYIFVARNFYRMMQIRMDTRISTKGKPYIMINS